MPGHNEVFHPLLTVNIASDMPALYPGRRSFNYQLWNWIIYVVSFVFIILFQLAVHKLFESSCNK